MKKFSSLLFVLLAMVCVEASMAAIVRGFVVDQETGEPLIGATVMVKDTTIGTATGLDGDFTINVEDGQQIVVSYISYLTQELTSVVGLTDLKVMLKPYAEQLAAVEVVARINLESEQAAIADQKEAVVATQVVGAKELSRKGVSDAEGAVMKVSGISKQEGVKNVFVRGLGDRYNSTTLNGLPISSEDPEYKNISLDFFSTDIIQSVNVNKAFYATGVSDVGGANIDVTSKQLKGYGELGISVSGGINTQTIGADVLKMDGVNGLGFANNTLPSSTTSSYGFKNQLTPSTTGVNIDKSIGISGGKRFDVGNNPLTFYVIAAYDNSYSYADEVVRSTTTSGSIYQDQMASISEINTSYLALANVNYMIGDKHTLDYNFMYVHSNTQKVGIYDGFNSNFEDWGGYSSLEGIVMRQQTNDNSMYINQILSKWTLSSRLKLDVSGSYNKIVGLEPDRRINTYGLESDGSYTQAKGDSSNQRFFSDLKEGDANIRAAVDYALSSDEQSRSSLKVGYYGRFVENKFDAMQYNHSISKTMDVSASDLALDDYFNSSNMASGYFAVSEMDSWYEISKSIHSAFADVTYEFSDRLIANLGLKYDLVNIDVLADLNGVPDSGGLSNKGFFLPSMNLRYKLSADHVMRLGVSKTYTLPQAKELSPYQYVGANFTSEGNPDLLPSDNYNVDLKWDWYISNGELLSVTGFYKHIVNPISRIQENSAGGVLSYSNISDHATAAGVEIEFRKNLLVKDLGEGKANKLTLGVNGSYIYTNAKVEAATDPTGSQLEGAAPFIANADLSFQMLRNKRGLTTTLVFNYVSDKVYTIGTQGYSDIVERGVPTLNFVTSANINEKLSLSLKASNLLNADFILERESSTNSDDTIVLSSYQKGIDISVGLSYKF